MMIGANGREQGTGNCENGKVPGVRRAFTLVEMLVVISIIGILAGLTLAVIPRVMDTRDLSRMKSFVNMLDTAIQNFHSTYNSYPQSNTNTYPALNGINGAQDSVTNSLFYELRGTTFDSAGFYHSPQDPSNTKMNGAVLLNRFGNAGLINSTNASPAGVPHDFLPELNVANYSSVLLMNPTVNEPTSIILFKTGIRANPGSANLATLNYDSSSTRRHNLKSYDIWVAWTNSTKPVIVGNF